MRMDTLATPQTGTPRSEETQLDRIGLADALLEPVFRLVASWWWLIALVVTIVILREVVFRKRPRRFRDKGYSTRTGRGRAASRKSSVTQIHPAHRVESPTHTITGRAYVTDGDGIRVARQEVRLAGLDAPEWDQMAKHGDGYWFNHGKRVKSALIQEIGGRHVRVSVEGTDKFGRLLGAVSYKGMDIGEWLVREGHAIAAYDDRYRLVEREAREAKRGMWSHAYNFDPRAHRHREARNG